MKTSADESGLWSTNVFHLKEAQVVAAAILFKNNFITSLLKLKTIGYSFYSSSYQ